MEGPPAGVRKGAWTAEEDKLLRACIQKYGEGKWHLVPRRAGLNRCRKSCRLRWLNYLNPNINRGNFTEDEVDMMMRFHKLLGNRWSLIAGRLPGRTANDVKNYWHTNLRSKLKSKPNKKESEKTAMKSHVVIKPQPRTFSKDLAWMGNNRLFYANGNNESTKFTGDSGEEPVLDNGNTAQQCDWWKSLLKEDNGDEGNSTWSSLLEEQHGTASFMENWDEEFSILEDILKEGSSCWTSTFDNSLDVNFWAPAPSN